MKIEIDLSDRRQLEKTRAELTHYLSIVEFALKEKMGKPSNGDSFSHFDPQAPEVAGFYYTADEAPIVSVIERLPKQFTTTDVVLGMGNEAKEKRGLIKSLLKRAEESNYIVASVRGKGRRPTQYEKPLVS